MTVHLLCTDSVNKFSTYEQLIEKQTVAGIRHGGEAQTRGVE